MTSRRAYRAPQLNVEITEEIIAEAIPRDSSHCMIAEAIAAQIPGASYISVDLATIRFTDVNAGRRYVYLTPGTAQRALIDFDRGHRPDPFAIKTRCAQIIPTGSARRARRAAAADDPTAPRRQNAQLVGEPGNGTIPLKVGGTAPDQGELGTGPGRAKGREVTHKGRRREFGIRALIR